MLQVFVIVVLNFEMYMLPLTLLIIFAKNLVVVQLVGQLTKNKDDEVNNLDRSKLTEIQVLILFARS